MWYRAINDQSIKFLMLDMLYKFTTKEDGKVYVTSGNNEHQVGLMSGGRFYPNYTFNLNFKHIYSEDHPVLLDMHNMLQITINNFDHIPEFIAWQVYKRINDVLSGTIEYVPPKESV